MNSSHLHHNRKVESVILAYVGAMFAGVACVPEQCTTFALVSMALALGGMLCLFAKKPMT